MRIANKTLYDSTIRMLGRVSTEMTDYLTRHAAFVAPLAHMLIVHGCDNYAQPNADKVEPPPEAPLCGTTRQ